MSNPPIPMDRLYHIAERYRQVHAVKADDFAYLMQLARQADAAPQPQEPSAEAVRQLEAIARDGGEHGLEEMCDLIPAILNAKTNGEAIGKIASFRYAARLDALRSLLAHPAGQREAGMCPKCNANRLVADMCPLSYDRMATECPMMASTLAAGAPK